MQKSVFFLLSILLSVTLLAQNSDPDVQTRAEQIEAQQQTKAAGAGSDANTPSQTRFSRLVDLAGRVPISFRVDGLGPGAGPAIGYAHEWRNSRDQIGLRLWGTAWLHGFYSAGAGAELRNVTAHDWRFAVEGSHSDAPQFEYYGLGPDSSIHNRTDYRREDTLFDFRVALRQNRHLAATCRLGQLLLNIGPGTNGSLPSTESVFGPSQAPGIDTQSNFLIAGCSTETDFRDFPEDPHKGTYAAAWYDRYYAEDHNEFSFHRVSAAAEQYLPFLNQKRVIVIRARTDLSFHSNNQVVPFYLQPTLGSDTELRGYRRYRFYDENLLALTLEYRWEIQWGIDMTPFFDAGNVYNRPGEVSLSHMKTSAGFGLRFRSDRRLIARLDLGFSREGFQTWFRFGKRL